MFKFEPSPVDIHVSTKGIGVSAYYFFYSYLQYNCVIPAEMGMNYFEM